MVISRVLPLCLVFIASLACAGSKPPPQETDGGPGDDQGEVGEEGEEGGVCVADTDCIPAQCCHPTSCVSATQAPDCDGIVCTLECQPGTMDCGQGHCECQGGSCTAVIDNPL